MRGLVKAAPLAEHTPEEPRIEALDMYQTDATITLTAAQRQAYPSQYGVFSSEIVLGGQVKITDKKARIYEIEQVIRIMASSKPHAEQEALIKAQHGEYLMGRTSER